jgi:single-strand DNA-binding protein
MATITVSGNLTDDPLLRFTTTGQAVATFSVAESRRWQDPDSQTWKESVSYFAVVAWGTLGQQVAESLSKGVRVVVIGHIDNNSETTEGDGRLKLEVTASEIAVSL